MRALTNARTEYGIGVSGTLATGDRSNTYSGDNASYEYARGWVSGEGLDNYKFSGGVRTLTDFDNIQIDINREDEQIVITNTGDYEQTGYEIEVSGSLEAYEASPSNIDGGRAAGTVDQGTDVYGYTGYVEEIVVDGFLRVTSSRFDRAGLKNNMDQLVHQHYDYQYESREFFEGGERGVLVFRTVLKSMSSGRISVPTKNAIRSMDRSLNWEVIGNESYSQRVCKRRLVGPRFERK